MRAGAHCPTDAATLALLCCLRSPFLQAGSKKSAAKVEKKEMGTVKTNDDAWLAGMNSPGRVKKSSKKQK